MKKLFILLALLLPWHAFVSAQHTLHLKSGESMQGEVTSLSDGTVSFLFQGNSMQFPVSDIASIDFEDGSGHRSGGPAPAGMKGVRYVLEGRTISKPPRFENLTMKKGIVSVSITVDKYGNVKTAEPGAEGTTTTDDYLLTLSQKAAQSTKFDNCAKCPLEMTGTMTFTY